jgi:hypothetical protein
MRRKESERDRFSLGKTKNALFTQDIFAHNIAIKRYCDKIYFWDMNVNTLR